MQISDNKKLINIILLLAGLYLANYFLSLKKGDIGELVLNILVIPFGVLAIIIHEVSHGCVANMLGDPTAKLAGRLSLNPVKHFDPLGVLCMILFHFGWAKPVPVDFSLLKKPRRDMTLVAIAGPLANLLLALAFMFLAKAIYSFDVSGGFRDQPAFVIESARIFFSVIMIGGIQINLMLMMFNLIPIPPLDGSRIITAMLPRDMAIKYNMVEPYGLIIIMFMIYSNLLGSIIMGPLELVYKSMKYYILGI